MSKRYEGEMKPLTGKVVCDVDIFKDGKVIPAYTPFELREDDRLMFTDKIYNTKTRLWEADYE